MATPSSQSGFIDNWQRGKSVIECNLHMLETEDFTDVTFLVGSEKHMVRAHRYVLASRSCVFHAMFCGHMTGKRAITIPDIEINVFEDFLSLTAPDGLMHILLHHGSNRREVYKAMYGQIVYGAKLAKPGTTLVFPEEIRSVVRERFPDAEAGAYDAQYDKSEKNLHLTLRQCVELKWRSPPCWVQTLQDIFKEALLNCKK